MLNHLSKRKSTKSLGPHDYNPYTLITKGHQGKDCAIRSSLVASKGWPRRLQAPGLLSFHLPGCRDSNSLSSSNQPLPVPWQCQNIPGRGLSFTREAQLKERTARRWHLPSSPAETAPEIAPLAASRRPRCKRRRWQDTALAASSSRLSASLFLSDVAGTFGFPSAGVMQEHSRQEAK